MKNTTHLLNFLLVFAGVTWSSFAQEVNINGKVVNSNDVPVNKVLIYLLSDPNIRSYSDDKGDFTLKNVTTAIDDKLSENNSIVFHNRKLLLSGNNKSISVNIYALDGRIVLNILTYNNFSGSIGLYPEAYLSELPQAIYVVQARVGRVSKSFKIQNLNQSYLPKGITGEDLNSIIGNSSSVTDKKSMSDIADTLILISEFYKKRSLPIITYSAQYDTIQLNNFTGYTMADEFEPEITHFHGGYGNFTDIYSADSVQFIIHYDTLAILEDHLKIIAIPIEGIEGLDNSLRFVSGLHFEPAGTTFTQPLRVGVILKDTVPEDLVVFVRNEQGVTSFLPYQKYLSDSCSIVFLLNHFSDIGVATGEIPPGPDPSHFTSSDQFLSYLAANSLLPEAYEVFFSLWYENVIDPMIDNITTIGDLVDAMNEFLWIMHYIDIIGTGEGPFVEEARSRFSYETELIWNALKNSYDAATNTCTKRDLLNNAAKLLKLIDLTDLSFNPSISEFGNGEYYDLVSYIIFAYYTKHLEIGQSYTVEYTLFCESGNPLPEVITWTSSKPSIATIDSDGKITAKAEGVTFITGRICDIESTFTLEVAGVDCETDFCNNPRSKCYSGIYLGSVTLPTYDAYPSVDCQYYKITEDILMMADLNNIPYFRYISSYWNVDQNLPAHIPEQDICILNRDRIPNPNWTPYGSMTFIGLGCTGLNRFSVEIGPWDNNLILDGRLNGNALILNIRKWVWWTDKYINSQIILYRIDL